MRLTTLLSSLPVLGFASSDHLVQSALSSLGFYISHAYNSSYTVKKQSRHLVHMNWVLAAISSNPSAVRPSLPYLLQPHENTQPSDERANEWYSPQAIELMHTPRRAPTTDGASTVIAEVPGDKNPNSPLELLPHAKTYPFKSVASV